MSDEKSTIPKIINPLTSMGVLQGGKDPESPKDIVRVTWGNINYLKPLWLKDEGILYSLKLFVRDIYEGADPAAAGEVLLFLKSALDQIPELAEENPFMFHEYLHLMVVLRLCLLITLPEEDILELFKSDLLLILEIPDVDLQNKLNIDLFLPLIKLPKWINEWKNSIIRIMEDNGEFLGTEPLNMTGRDQTFLPTVRNWLIDYRGFSSTLSAPSAKIPRRGGYERSAYITQSQNVKRLTKDAKDILVRLLELYDWLRFGALGSIPEPRPQPAFISSAEESPSRVIPTPPVASPPVPAVHGAPLEEFKKRVEGGGMRVEGRPSIQMTPAEIKRETSTVELPSTPKEELLPKPPQVPPQTTLSRPVIRPDTLPQRGREELEKNLDLTDAARLKTVSLQTPMQQIVRLGVPVVRPPSPALYQKSVQGTLPQRGRDELNKIQTIDDLKKIDLSYLRGGNVQTQILNLKSLILKLAAANHILPYYAVTSFEQSPLFKAYLQVGSMMINDTTIDRASAFKVAVAKAGINLTLPEFEAIADLRKEIEKM